MIKTHEGREMRGQRIRLYTTERQDLILRDQAAHLRAAWNWLCARAKDVANAREAYAARYHAVERPARPASRQDNDDSARTETAAYREQLKAYRAQVRAVCKDVDAVSYRSVKDWCGHFGVKQPYQLFGPALGESELVAPAHLLDALCKDYHAALAATKRGQAPPRRKRDTDHVTLRTRSGQCFRLRAAGPRPDMRAGSAPGRTDWLDCEVHLPGVGWIAGRLGTQRERLEAEEYWVEGVSVIEETDGWYASIRQWVVPRTVIPSTSPSPDTRWEGYGLPSSLTAQRANDSQRSPNWEQHTYRDWCVAVRDRYPNGVPGEEPVLVQHRWRISLQRPNGQRVDPQKSCPTREEAIAWAKARVDSYLEHERPGTKLALSPVTSPERTGGTMTVGTDVGLANLVTISSPAGELQSGNPRALDLLEALADMQRQERPTGPLHTRSARRTRQLLYGVLHWIGEAHPDELHVLETERGQSIQKWVAQEGHGRTRSSGGYTPGAGWLIAQLKARYTVREVERYNNTRTCSQCGKESEIKLDRKTREAVCEACEHRIDQDLGASRNARRKTAKRKAA